MACSGVSCQAASTLESLPLSNYEFPKIPSGFVQAAPLEEAVKEAVKHLQQAPFLHIQRGGSVSRHDVDNTALQIPQVWDRICNHLREVQADIVMLVHRLEAPKEDRVTRTVERSASVLTGITNAAQQGRLQSFDELLRTGTAHAEYSGKVGDCCEEDEVSQIVPFKRHSHNHGSKQNNGGFSFKKTNFWRDNTPNYWGVVLESKDGIHDNGCYILKTVHSGIDDCTCIHWTLTKVTRGASLFNQINAAWLL